MPDSKLPDISLQILFSMSRPHMFWYSWKTDKEKNHRWESEAFWWTREDGGRIIILWYKQCWDYTPARRWGLLRAHRMALNWDSSVPTLFSPAPYSFCRPSRHRNLKKKKEHDQASQFHECHNTKPTYLSVLFDQGDVNGLSFVTISLDRARHIEPIKHTVDISVHMRWILFWESSSGVKRAAAATWQRETRSLRKWPEVSLMMASSKLFPYSGRKALLF